MRSLRPVAPARRRGIASMLAMLYLVLFAVLAIGYCAATITNTQVSHNDAAAIRTLLAAESGLDFMRYQMANLNLPYDTTSANLLDHVAGRLSQNLDETPNMEGSVVVVDGGAIYLPSKTGWIPLGAAAGRFRVTITQASGTTTLNVHVRGGAAGSAMSRAVRLSFTPEALSYALVGLDGVTMSLSAYTDSYDSSKGSYSAANARNKGSIVSNGNISLSNTVRVKGDARPGVGKMLTLYDSATVTGRIDQVPAPLTFPSATLPATYTYLGNVNNSGGTQNVAGGVYLIDHLTLSGSATVNWQGPVTLYIRNSYNVSGNVIINTYQNDPANRKIYFLPTCATATWTGSNICVGDLYAPDTHFTISGDVQKFGRIIARTIDNSSTGGMHADEALPLPGGAGNYVPDADSYTEE